MTPVWIPRTHLPIVGESVMIDGRKGTVQYVGPNKTGKDVVQVLYAGQRTAETTTLQEFLATLEVQKS